jgi:hypothetical protein
MVLLQYALGRYNNPLDSVLSLHLPELAQRHQAVTLRKFRICFFKEYIHVSHCRTVWQDYC